MEKRVFIIHGWDGSPEGDWLPWIKNELETRSFEVYVPAMPDPEEPIIEKWVGKLDDVAGMKPDEDAIFVGHSIGCQTILRYLEKMSTSGFIGGAVFVAPWLYIQNLSGEKEEQIAKPWVDTPIHNPNVFKHIPQDKIIAIFSDNDPYVPEENMELFEKGFGARIIIEKNKGHITREDGVKELPSALASVLEIAGGSQLSSSD